MISFLSCGNNSDETSFSDSEVFVGEYYSNHARTSWNFTFEEDLTFEFSTSGHFGNLYSNGVYRFIDDTLTIKSSDTMSNGELRFNNYKLLKQDTILIDLTTKNIYFTASNKVNVH